MADENRPAAPAARGALDAFRSRFAAINGDVALAATPLARHYNLRVGAGSDAARAVESVLGTPLPGPLSWTSSWAGRSVAWLGPDEWLVLDPLSSPALETALREGLGDAGAVVEQSGQRVSLMVIGDGPGLLAKGTALDLRPKAFPRGTALQGLLGQAVVLFLSHSDDSTRIELIVRSSFARYAADWLLDAIRDPLAYPAGHGATS